MGLLRQYSKNITHVTSPGKGGGGSRRQQQPQLQQTQRCLFRWEFQPCNPLGGIDSFASTSLEIQSISTYNIELESYCTDDDEDDKSDGNTNGGDFY